MKTSPPSKPVTEVEIVRRYLQAAKDKRELADEMMIDARALLSEAAGLQVAAENVQARKDPSSHDPSK